MKYVVAILISVVTLVVALFLMHGMRISGWSSWIVWGIGLFIAISGGYASRSVMRSGPTQGDDT